MKPRMKRNGFTGRNIAPVLPPIASLVLLRAVRPAPRAPLFVFLFCRLAPSALLLLVLLVPACVRVKSIKEKASFALTRDFTAAGYRHPSERTFFLCATFTLLAFGMVMARTQVSWTSSSQRHKRDPVRLQRKTEFSAVARSITPTGREQKENRIHGERCLYVSIL